MANHGVNVGQSLKSGAVWYERDVRSVYKYMLLSAWHDCKRIGTVSPRITLIETAHISVLSAYLNIMVSPVERLVQMNIWQATCLQEVPPSLALHDVEDDISLHHLHRN